MMLLSLSHNYRQSHLKLFNSQICLPTRSYSDDQIRHKPVEKSQSKQNQSIDLFSLIMPSNKDPLSSLICSICSLPMIKPTTLPCQHTFCLQCIRNSQQIRFGSLPICSNSHSLSNINQTKLITCQKCSRIHQINSLSDLEENQSMKFLINTLLCETCHQLYPSNQLDTCLHCFGVLCPNCYDDHLKTHQNDSSNIKTHSNSIQTSKSSSEQSNHENENENLDSIQMNSLKKKSNSFLRRIIHSSRHRHTHSLPGKDSTSKSSLSSTKQTETAKQLFRSKTSFTIKIEDMPKTDSKQPTTPVTPVRRFLNLHDQYIHTSEHIKQCKQRQLELDYTVKKLIDILTLKTNENLQQISTYWFYIKKNLLEQYQIKSNHLQIFDYLMNKTCCSVLNSQKQIELYVEKNDEIHACLQVLSSTLMIIYNQQNLLTINQLFDREEQTTIEMFKRQLGNLSSTYAEEISFIIERIHVYETRFSSWKDSNLTDLDSIAYEWTQIIEHDYPSIIERISNDFINKIPQLESTLIHMLRKMKQRLININNQPSSRRTSNS